MFELKQNKGMIERTLQLGLQGTCTLILYRMQYFVLFTRHQIALIANETPQDFHSRMELLYVLMDDGRDSTNLPIRSLLFSFDGDHEDDDNDFVVGVIEEPMLTSFMREQFFPVERLPIGEIGDRALAAGFPGEFQQVLMEKQGLRILASCKYGTVMRRATCSTGVLSYGEDGQSLDGMSGGAVFLVRPSLNCQQDNTFVIFLDGIVQRGGNGYVYYLTIERILDKIDKRVFATHN